MHPCPVHPNELFEYNELLYQHAKNSSEHHDCCDICRRVFIDACSLRNHTTAKHSSGATLEQPTEETHNYTCLACRRPFISERAWKQHVTDVHTSYYCSICSVTLDNKAAIQQHAIENHGHICTACDLPFNSISSLLRHTSDAHGSYSCHHCHKRFRSQMGVDQHIWSKHDGLPSPPSSFGQESNSSSSEMAANVTQADPPTLDRQLDHNVLPPNTDSIEPLAFDSGVWADVPRYQDQDVTAGPQIISETPVQQSEELVEQASTSQSIQIVLPSNSGEPATIRAELLDRQNTSNTEIGSILPDNQSTPPRMYKNLVSLLDAKIAKLEDILERGRYTNVLRTCMDSMTGDSIILGLVNRDQYRAQLITLTSELKCQDDREVCEAIDQDEADIITMLQEILNCDTEKKAILQLRGEDAERFLILIHDVIDNMGSLFDNDGQCFRQSAHRLLVKLSENSGILPPSLHITGVENCSKNPVAEGGFADIFRATYRGKGVALKRLRCFQQRREVTDRMFCREALFWQNLNHPNVLPFYGVELDTFFPRLSMVSPWMDHGTIRKHIAKSGGPQAVNVERHLLEISQGLQYLHSRNIIHGDLRGNNIFIDDGWHVRLADFGLAVFANATFATHGTSSNAGSIRWMAPELYRPEASDSKQLRRTYASDIYALACVCLEIYTGRDPFYDIVRDPTVILKVMEGGRPARPAADIGKTISDDLWNLVELCWRQQPSDRPKIEDIVQKLR